MRKLKWKPQPRWLLFSCYWWNPFFWLGVILAPFVAFFRDGAVSFYETAAELIDGLRRWDLD